MYVNSGYKHGSRDRKKIHIKTHIQIPMTGINDDMRDRT